MENRFEPEAEQPVFQHNKIVMPKKQLGKTKLTTKRKQMVKRFLIKIAIVFLLIVSALTYGTYKVNEWFNTHTIKWQSPIQTPLWVEPRVSKLPTGYEVIHEARAAEQPTTVHQATATRPAISNIVSTIYQLESSSTNSAGCAAKGLYNGYGYIPGSCYKSHEEVQALVTKWVEKRIGNMPLNKLLCGYNLGFDSDHLIACMNQSAEYHYYRDYLNLN